MKATQATGDAWASKTKQHADLNKNSDFFDCQIQVLDQIQCKTKPSKVTTTSLQTDLDSNRSSR